MLNNTKDLNPKISINYTIGKGYHIKGTFRDIPLPAYEAEIIYEFPIIGADGELHFASTSYKLYIGQEIVIDKALKTSLSQSVAATLKECQNKGIKRIVAGGFGILPLGDNDAVCTNYEQMVDTINNIYTKFNDLDIIINTNDKQKNK